MRPEEFAARIDEADAWLRGGQVDEAIATGRELLPALKRDVDQTPDDPASWYQFALGLVLARDRAMYRRACAATLERFSQSNHPGIGDAARACMIGPDAVEDPSVPRRMAEAALARDPKVAWRHYVLGLAHFREGRYERAVEDLTRSLELGADWAAAPLNFPVLAMAYHALGQNKPARQWLERAHGRPAGSTRGDEVGGAMSPSAPWWDRVEFQLLLREADVLLHDATFPADAFAPP